MPFQFQVTQIYGKDTWQSNFGPMLGWKLGVKNLSNNQDGFAEINSKPDRPYNVGDTFWAEVTGERNGVPKLKRVNPKAAPAAGGGSPWGAAKSDGAGQGKIPYSRALAAYQRFAQDMEQHEHATSLFLAWLRGQIGDPPMETEEEPAGSAPFPGDDDVPF